MLTPASYLNSDHRFEVQGHIPLYTKLETALSYIRSLLKLLHCPFQMGKFYNYIYTEISMKLVLETFFSLFF